MKNILITGGAGYIGTRLSNMLCNKGYKVNVLDTFLYGNYLNKKINTFNINILDKDRVVSCMDNIDTVIHLAAISNDPTGNLNPKTTMKVNLDGTKIVCDAAKKAGVQRFIFASSSSVFGIQEGENITEECSINPITPYSEAKALAEKYILDNASSSFVTTAVRPATVCGPSPRQRFDLVVNALTGSGFFDNKITVYGGTQRRPNITIEDMLFIYKWFIEIDAVQINGEVFNAGWDNKTILDLAKIVSKELGNTSIEIKEATDIRDYHITSTKIEKLGFRPQCTISEMIKELYCIMNSGFILGYKEKQYHNLKVLTHG